MNPWWLKPPAEEGPAKDSKPTRPARETQKNEKAEPPEKKEGSTQRRSGRGRGPKRRRAPASRDKPKADSQPQIAVFYDVESLVQGAAAAGLGEPDLDRIMVRLAEKGRIMARRAYGDWQRHGNQQEAARQAGLEIVDLSGKDLASGGSPDIKLAVDAMELCASKDSCEVFVIISGNGDFSPLVAKLRQSGSQVVGIGVREAVSAGFADLCSEYLYYEDLTPPPARGPVPEVADPEKAAAFVLLVETVKSMQEASEATLWGSALKQEMGRRSPEFDVAKLGYSTFSDLLEDAERLEVIHLERDDRSGGYYVAGIASE